MVGCINWLATCTRPDISPCLTFLASYNQCPSHGHYQAALHALKYLYSTADYASAFTQTPVTPSKPSIISPHITIKKLTPTQLPPPPETYNDLPLSPTLAGGANSATPSPMAHSAVSLVMSYDAQGGQSAGNQSVKITHHSAPAKLRS
eukprot:scaffold69885_cov36-Cyclotella_meneghiniana.AAC.4